MADVPRHAKTTALLLQDLQHELIKGSRPIVPVSGAELAPHPEDVVITKHPTVQQTQFYLSVTDLS
jgi:hypothetical protein